jgi:uncharacterized 2Fe-2S/4Fe-4S cluster protein (DUF4445 family)
MGYCINHPDRETQYLCMKDNIYFCEECLKCRNPEIYCKFRPSCPIWFIVKKGFKSWGGDDEKEKESSSYKVIFQPDNKQVNVKDGETLLDAAQKADVPLNASCNGKGACGKCKLIVVSGETKSEPTSLLTNEEKDKKYVLACKTTVHSDVSVRVPEETLEKHLKVAGMGKEATERLKGLVDEISPMLLTVNLEMDPPSLEDPVSDLDRLNRALSKQKTVETDRLNVGLKVMQDLAKVMRDENWSVNASIVRKRCSNEVMTIESGLTKEASLGVAVDLGTTSIVVYLVDMSDGAILGATSGHNRQAACGDDVINRVVCAEKDGVKKLSAMVLATINGLINELIHSANVNRHQIKNATISGNTIMTHLLLKIDPRYIRREPYIPTVSDFPIFQAKDVGLKINPIGAVFVLPGPASYVGGDIVSGVLYTGFYQKEALTLFIDVGTNGEIVLGNNDWLMTASCSAGPAFEGGGVRWGMRAEDGAIEKVSISKETLEPDYQVVGSQKPRGICGSGMIDLISEMMMTGIINQSGKFEIGDDHPRIIKDKYDIGYVIAYANETDVEKDIVFTETDIDNLIRSKGAIYAGFLVLLEQAGLNFSMLDQIILTGGFGQYLNIEKAINIGMLPELDHSKFKYMGNSSIAGAYMCLLSETFRKEARTISNNMTYIDFSSSNQYMDEFTSALFLPHTNTTSFPNVMQKMKQR